MNKKLSVLRRITAVVLCVTLLSSQVVVANAEDSERMNVQTNSENADISEQDGFSSDTSEISDITESDIPDSFEGESEPNTDISSEVTEEFGNSKDQGFTDCIFRKNCASVPEERSAIPLQTEQSSAG